MLTRFEVARAIGLRALQLEEGHEPRVACPDPALRRDTTYVAALEMHTRALPLRVVRNSLYVDASTLALPPELTALLNTRDGGSRVHDYAWSEQSAS